MFLHDVLDVWFEKVVKQHCRGEACLIRYADDFVCAFEEQADAERFYNVLGQRLGKFGLELSAAKTRIIPFSRDRLAGKTSFEFLGCELRWGKDRKEKDHLKRRTARKKLRKALKRFTAWCKENRHLRLPVLFQRLNAKLRGYYNYYGVHGNAASLKEFFNSAMGILLKWLNRVANATVSAHRLWLDVKEQNTRARAVYEKEGFRYEGTLRECLKGPEGFERGVNVVL